MNHKRISTLVRCAGLLSVLAWVVGAASATEYHVSVQGSDKNDGSSAKPFKTIWAATQVAQPGDVITIHEGTYRERITPPRGGESDSKRIVYQAATGEKAVIKGSEVVKGWEKAQNDTWKVVIPNSFFGGFNPYNDPIKGDWFDPRGRVHHTGAVYLNGHWLIEAAKQEDALAPVGQATPGIAGAGDYLLNVAWIKPELTTGRVAADSFAAQQGVQTAACSEGGQCIGWIENGDWARYDKVDFGPGSEQVEIRAASVTEGGIIELRLDSTAGPLLGTCLVTNTGDWQSWSSFRAMIKPTSGVHNLCLVFKARKSSPKVTDTALWFAKVDAADTTIWAQFPGVNPNEVEVEINVRRVVFYPDKPGINYLTIRGLTMMHAATPWAPPTAEQPGLVGTHWSKGWIIENNDIRYSTCVGVALGKYGDQYDNTSQNSAEGYVETINRATKNGWNKDTIGHHIVRNNHISNCEQAGVVGSLGAVFSTITGNEIHDIHIRQLFSGAEMAGIKIHAAIDTEISGNHIYRTCRGIWLDWMAQGTRVTGNLLHDNGPAEDLFVEVDHGPFVVDNNIFLSRTSLLDMSEGGTFAHNLFAGRIQPAPELGRETPFHKPHSTEVAGLKNIAGGDHRYYNNIFVGNEGLALYDKAAQPVQMAGNIFLKGAKPCAAEKDPLVSSQFDPAVKLVEEGKAVVLEIKMDGSFGTQTRPFVTTALLGQTAVSGLPFKNRDDSALEIGTDFLGKPRNRSNPSAGPFEQPGTGNLRIKVK
jgi:alpha-N-arabinofuranosidase